MAKWEDFDVCLWEQTDHVCICAYVAALHHWHIGEQEYWVGEKKSTWIVIHYYMY